MEPNEEGQRPNAQVKSIQAPCCRLLALVETPCVYPALVAHLEVNCSDGKRGEELLPSLRRPEAGVADEMAGYPMSSAVAALDCPLPFSAREVACHALEMHVAKVNTRIRKDPCCAFLT